MPTRTWADRPFTPRLSKYSDQQYTLRVWWILSILGLSALVFVGLRVGNISHQYSKTKADAVMWRLMDASETAVFVLEGYDGTMVDANKVARRRYPFAIENGKLTNNLPYGNVLRTVVDDNIEHARKNGHYYTTVVQLPPGQDGQRQAAVIRTAITEAGISTMLILNSSDTFLDLSTLDLATN